MPPAVLKKPSPPPTAHTLVTNISDEVYEEELQEERQEDEEQQEDEEFKRLRASVYRVDYAPHPLPNQPI